jgi:glycosyltransferase involved in cell wall biosynthesis
MNSAGLQITQDEGEQRRDTSPDALRVVLVQPLIPAYNIPVYEAIAQLEGIDFTVWADLKSTSQLNQYDKKNNRFAAEHLPTKHLGPFITRPGLLRRLMDERPDVVILNGNQRDLSDAAALSLCRLLGCGVGVWNMFHRNGPPLWWTDRFMAYLGRVSHLLLIYGERGRTEQLKRGTPPEKINVISTAIDERHIMKVRDSITDRELEEFVSEEGLSDKHVLLHVARINETKRPDHMVRYFARLLETRSDVELVWIGGGPLEDMVKKDAAERGIANKMRFLGPIYNERKLAPWYLSASVFVSATGVGLSMHHAMCYGLPVVTDDNRQTQPTEFEVLQSGVNGFTFQSGDAVDFVDKINLVLDDRVLREQLSWNARHRLEVEYTLARKVENVAAALAFLQSKSRKGCHKNRIAAHSESDHS